MFLLCLIAVNGSFSHTRSKSSLWKCAGLCGSFSQRINGEATRPTNVRMKKVITILIASATLVSSQAQLVSPDSVNGAVWGGLVGGVLGGNRHHGFSGNGAAIGAGVGLLAGSLAGSSRRYAYYDEPSYFYSSAPSVSLGYGYGNCGSSAYTYYTPNNYLAPGFYYRPTRPNYAVSGTILGATSGALIGAGRHDAGKGALIGAAAGLALGSIAERSAKREDQRVVASQTAAQQTVAAAQPTLVVAPQQFTPVQITSSPVATSTYYWTPRPQINDAPRVPDAPTY